MVFSDPAFLFYFLPLVLLTYWAGGWRHRNLFLLLSSLAFYTAGGGSLVLLVVLSAAFTYAIGLYLGSTRNRSRGRRARVAGITLLLASLIVWKYLGFIWAQISQLFAYLGDRSDTPIELVLPVAISFYTFQCVSYIIDVGRGDIASERNPITFLCYVMFFPQLIAGPIVRFRDVAEQLTERPTDLWNSFSAGAPRFLWGLAKKVLIADQAGHIADAAFGIAGYQVTLMDTVVGVLAYTIQIYFDFSGYSDMAIGMSHMFGIRFPENFRRPYSADSVTDFWRRWHISLSSWFRDYVYIPLGGNQRGKSRTYLNLIVVFVLTGFWHGAAWTFLAWGLIHGAALILERLLFDRSERPQGIRWAARKAWALAVVMFGWLFFRSTDLTQARELLVALDGRNGILPSPLVDAALTTQRLFWSSLGLMILLGSPTRSVGDRLGDPSCSAALRFAAVSAGSLASLYVMSSSFSPFLYFQF